MRALTLLASLAAADPPEACFSEHLREAIALNRARAPAYAALSGGASADLSRRLIASEYATLAGAYLLEAAARPYWEVGAPVLCADFAPMSAAPPLQAALHADPPSLAAFEAPDPAAIEARVRAALGAGDLAAAHAALEREIGALAEEPRLSCMTRHMLESAARIAWLAPQYDARAEGLDRPPPSKISLAVLALHLQALPLAADLDARAAPLAAQGVGIVCDDVPPIDVRPTL